MDNEKMARFITELRKSKGLTQKELAQQLGITDKAVSKWERGLSCPDISLLTTLSDILGITTSELLNGEKAEESVALDVEIIVENSLQYANTVTNKKWRNIRVALAIMISVLSILGIIVCSIVNLAITGNLTWAWFPISALVFAWQIVMPVIVFGKKGVSISLVLVSFLIIPFLFVLENIIGVEKLIMPIGIPVSILSIIYLWGVYLLVLKSKWAIHIIVAVASLIGLPLSFGINYIVSKQIGEPIIDIWDILVYLILAIVAANILGCRFIKQKRGNV